MHSTQQLDSLDSGQPSVGIARHPFNRSDADVVLRSSDENPVDFYVFKFLLRLASPFFELLLSLPRPPGNVGDGIPVISMAEDKDTLELMLRFCYSISVEELPRLSSLLDLQMVRASFHRILATTRICDCMPLWLDSRSEDGCEIYSSSSHKCDELELITAAMYIRLQEHHKEYGDAAASKVILHAHSPYLDEEWVWTTCLTCSRAGGYSIFGRNSTSSPGVRKWWVDWMTSVAEELRRVTSTTMYSCWPPP